MRIPLYYILDGKIAKQCDSVLKWAVWMNENSCYRAKWDEMEPVGWAEWVSA